MRRQDRHRRIAICLATATVLAASVVCPGAARAFGIFGAEGLERGVRWDAAPRSIDGVERSLDGGLRYSLSGGSYAALRDSFSWSGSTPSLDDFQQAVDDAFNAWTATDPVSGLHSTLSFFPDFSTPVADGSTAGAEIDVFAADLGDSGTRGHTSIAWIGGQSLTLTSGTIYNAQALVGADVKINANPDARYSLNLFRLLLTHEIGHSLGLGDVDLGAGPAGNFIDDNFNGSSAATAAATLTNSFAALIDPHNPAASPVATYTVDNADPGFDTPGVNILMESRLPSPLLGNLTPLQNDDYAGRQFLYPVVPLSVLLTWDNQGGAGNLDWTTAANWDPNRAPDAVAAIHVDNGDTVALSSPGQEARSVALSGGSSLHVADDGRLTVARHVSVAAGGTLRVDGALSAAEVSAEGTLAGNGSIDARTVAITGTVSPGSKPGQLGTLTIGDGQTTLAGSATYEVQVGLADAAADQIELSPTGSLQLGGTLAVTGTGRTNASVWATGVSRRIVDGPAGSVTGTQFDDVVPAPAADATAHVGQGAFLRDVRSTTSGVDLDLFIAIGGDADGDGKVWLADWASLRANFGNTGSGLGWTDGNFEPWLDDKVWLSDWALLRANFGNRDYTAAEGAATAVPEPSTMVMLLAGLIVLICRRRW